MTWGQWLFEKLAAGCYCGGGFISPNSNVSMSKSDLGMFSNVRAKRPRIDLLLTILGTGGGGASSEQRTIRGAGKSDLRHRRGDLFGF